MKTKEKYLLKAIKVAIQSGKIILDEYNSDNKEFKFKDNNTPLTRADTLAHKFIYNNLSETKLPIVSEEGEHIDYDIRKNWATFWLVDPLDGSKEFLNRNGEFTVNIALISNKAPILGVVYVPVTGELYYAKNNFGSFKIKNITDYSQYKKALKIPLNNSTLPEIFTVVVSRSHINSKTHEYLESLRNEKGKIVVNSYGSSLKICKVAEGLANVYPRLGPTMEWDTGAAHAIAIYSGKNIINFSNNEPLEYNKESQINPHFLVY